MRYKFADARGAQARGCLLEIEEVLAKWNFRIVPGVHPFITRGYEAGSGIMQNLSEGYEDEPSRTVD